MLKKAVATRLVEGWFDVFSERSVGPPGRKPQCRFPRYLDPIIQLRCDTVIPALPLWMYTNAAIGYLNVLSIKRLKLVEGRRD